MTRATAQQQRLKTLGTRLRMRQYRSLGDIYRPASDGISLKVNTPDSMSLELHAAIDDLMERVGNLDDYVGTRLGYKTLAELYKAFSAEQVDGLALAIYNIEKKGEGVIIADQTGIGKGRIAAGIIRYAVLKGKQPVFMTEKPNLFSDIYRDLTDIGAGNLVPFIVNAKEDKTDIKDKNENILFRAEDEELQNRIIESGYLPERYNLLMLTYSQISKGEKDKKGKFIGTPKKLEFLRNVSEDNIVILDESHNAAGDSNTGKNLQTVATICKGIVFLSATFAKRSENMPIYAMKTSMKQANLSKEAVTVATDRGGVALQEIISADLVSQGQLVRRERTFEGVEINYLVTNNEEPQQRAKSDIVTDIIRRIIKFQEDYVFDEIERLDQRYANQNASVEVTKGTNKAGVDATPFVSKIFNSINQLLFAIKTEAVLERSLIRLKQGKSVVIAFSSTMESFLKATMEANPDIKVGSVINADFSNVLVRALDGVLRYTIKDAKGKATYASLDINSMSDDAIAEYNFIKRKITASSTNLVISPIDQIISGLESQGYKVAEVTGRNYKINLGSKPGASGNARWIGTIQKRQKENVSDAFNRFNRNEVDVLLINQAGSTGASAHAIVTDGVPASKVKVRAMIVAQPELDINKEVQKRGRVMRTGQIYLPCYDYIISAVPSEKRLSMMLQKKLKSLDANTTSNQKTSAMLMKSDDFLNKYGDKIVTEFLCENYEFNKSIGNPLNISYNKDREVSDISKVKIDIDSANKVSGRVAILPCAAQEEFYDEIIRRYQNYVALLIESDSYDLEVQVLDLKAEILEKEIILTNSNPGTSPFAENTYLLKCLVNVLKKPFTTLEVENKLKNVLQGISPKELAESLVQNMKITVGNRLEKLNQEDRAANELLISKIKNSKPYKAIKDAETRQEFYEHRVSLYNDSLNEDLARNKRKYTNEADTLERFFMFFKVGRLVNVPNEFENISSGFTRGIVQGFDFGSNKKNRFAPSNITLKIMMASSKRQLSIDLTSGNMSKLYAIKGISSSMETSLEYNLQQYAQGVIESSKERNLRYIAVGNMLQFYGSEFKTKGKLVEYTNFDGSISKGALLPESYATDIKDDGGIKVSVPINSAKKIIDNLPQYKSLQASSGLEISFQFQDRYFVSVPKARDQGGMVYLNPKILKLVRDNDFQSFGQRMKAYVSKENIDALLDILSYDLYYTVQLSKYDFEQIKNNFTEKTGFKIGNSNIRQNKPKPSLPVGAKAEPEASQPSAAAAQAQRIRILKLKYKYQTA
jgi:hypothetical protein